jgi:hypothetical protein
MKVTREMADNWHKLHIEEGYSLGMIGKLINPDYVNPEQIIRRAFQRFKLNYHKCYRKGKENLNHNFFHEIDSEIKAYLLGYITADGCVVNNSLQIASIDLELLELIKSYISPDQTIYKCKLRINKANNGQQSQKYCIHINNMHLINDLAQYGIIPNKTYKNMLFPDLKPDLIKHYIRGFFDGDGSIYLNKSRNTAQIKFSNTSLNILQTIQNYFNFCNFYYEIFPSSVKGINIYYMSNNSRAGIKGIFKSMYNNSNFFLSRKYNKFLEFLNKQGELLETPTCERDNQQPSLSSNTLEGSTTNFRPQTDNAVGSNEDTSALPLSVDKVMI